MSEQILLAAIVLCVVAYLVYNQINKITNKIDSIDKPKLYADFSAIIQAKIREIRLDIDTFKTSLNAKYILNDENELTSSLELLSDLIRQLVFLETMSGKNQNPQETESKLFEVLNELDNFISKK
ncbi:MAG: hypothetical protein LBG67_03890, partial [Campylobacteraceae bacterium]|nr:hypothetical protein [Campylobacteraceae bacterium]